MRLLYLANIPLPSDRAHAAQIFSMCNGFVQAGIETSLVVADRKTDVVTAAPEAYYGQKQLFALHKLKTLELIHLGRFFFYFSSLIFGIKAIHLFKKNNFEVVYSREELLLYILSFFIHPKQMAWESHQAKNNFFVRSLLKRGTKLIVISEGIRDYYTERGIALYKILVAHDAVDASFFEEQQTKEQARLNLGLPLKKKIAMYIGGFDSWKGVETFFDASNEKPDILFTAIGGKDYEVEKFKLRFPKVFFLGARPYRELASHQQAADILIIPNTSKSELSSLYTSPLKLFAHLTSKVPMVVSDVPSIRNILQDKHAFFFKPDDSHSLVQTIDSAINNREEAQAKKQAAYELSRHFTWKARAEQIKAFIS